MKETYTHHTHTNTPHTHKHQTHTNTHHTHTNTPALLFNATSLCPIRWFSRHKRGLGGVSVVGWQYAITAKPITSLTSLISLSYLTRNAAILD